MFATMRKRSLAPECHTIWNIVVERDHKKWNENLNNRAIATSFNPFTNRKRRKSEEESKTTSSTRHAIEFAYKWYYIYMQNYFDVKKFPYGVYEFCERYGGLWCRCRRSTKAKKRHHTGVLTKREMCV